MNLHVDSQDCWCHPRAMRECPVCVGTGVHPADDEVERPPPCPQCLGERMVPANHFDETTVLIHKE